MELWQKIALLLAAILDLFLDIFILQRGRRKSINIFFSIFLFSIVTWILFVYLSLHFAIETVDYAYTQLFGKLAYAFGSLTISCFLVFCEVFPIPSNPKKLKKRIFFYYSLGLAAFAFSLTNFLQKGLRLSEGGYLVPDFNWGLHVWDLFLIWAVGYGLYKLIAKYISLGLGHEKLQLKYTFFALAGISIASAIVFPLIYFFSNEIGLVVIAPSMSAFMVMLITYAIVRHRLMDLGIVFRNTLIYGSVMGVLIVVNLILLFVLSKKLGLPSWVSMIFSSTVIVFTVGPIRSKMEDIFYRYVFKTHRHNEIIGEISDALTGIMDLDGLRKVVVDKLVETLQLESGCMFIANRDNTGYSMYYSTFGGKSEDETTILESDNILVKTLYYTRKILLLDELKRTLKESAYKKYEEHFQRISSTALLPLIIKDMLIGIVALGSKKSKDIYSYEDVNMLNVLGNQMATALENSRLFDEILAVRNHYGSILQHLRSGVVTMQSNKKINTINQRAKNILNLGDEELVGQPVEKLGNVLAAIMINRQTTRKDFYDDEILLDIPGRGRVPLGIICTIMRDKKGPAGVLMVIDDLTVEKQLQERIRRSDKLASVGTLAAGMAHEIKNPLVSIKTFAQLLPEKFDDISFREKFSSITFQEVERINHIVEQLLNFARPMKPNLLPVDMHQILSEVIDIIAGEAEKAKVEIICEYASEPAIVEADPDQMKQVFLNLIQNSIQAMDKKGRIQIKTSFIYDNPDNQVVSSEPEGFDIEELREKSVEENRKRKLIITITDNGKGIPKEIIQSLFDPFFTTRSEGFGLGLAIVHGIIEEHRSTIQIESEEGKWTRVTVKMPADKKLETAEGQSLR